MSKIAVIIADLFEDSEYTEPAKEFQNAGHTLIHVGLKSGETVKGKKKNTPVEIQKTVEDVSKDEFDALLIPGGYSPDKLRADDKAVRFVKDFFESGKPVFTICHGPQLLITADVLRGRKVTGWKSIVQDIKNAGADFLDQEVVVDGNLTSSRHPGDLPAFIKASLDHLAQQPLPNCTVAPSAEHARASNEDEPCDDARGKQ
ncbi:MAG: type 1 glutamine amidotransferase [Deltaproteobacteria bacterium]|nr:type 1 glutamine amidotransferase [Deltaproteobacteria bacterium]